MNCGSNAIAGPCGSTSARNFALGESVLNGDEASGLSELVLSGFLRVVTHDSVFAKPGPLAARWSSPHNCAGARTACRRRRAAGTGTHWEVFCGLCAAAGAKGKLVPEA